MSEICPKCGSNFIEKRIIQNINHNPPHDITYRHESVCGACYYVFRTVFDCITTSPKVLAESLVFWEGGWTSRFINFTTTNREEAVDATVEKLNEARSDLSEMQNPLS
jgi:hypothetical protein